MFALQSLFFWYQTWDQIKAGISDSESCSPGAGSKVSIKCGNWMRRLPFSSGKWAKFETIKGFWSNHADRGYRKIEICTGNVKSWYCPVQRAASGDCGQSLIPRWYWVASQAVDWQAWAVRAEKQIVSIERVGNRSGLRHTETWPWFSEFVTWQKVRSRTDTGRLNMRRWMKTKWHYTNRFS